MGRKHTSYFLARELKLNNWVSLASLPVLPVLHKDLGIEMSTSEFIALDYKLNDPIAPHTHTCTLIPNYMRPT